MSKPTIYLAGPVMNLDDGGAGWREDVIENYDDQFQFNNPLGKYNVPAESLTVVHGTSGDSDHTVGVDEIVTGDKELLRDSDAVLVGYEAVRSIGTPMEVMWAFERNYPVAIWIRDSTPIDELSPWYQYHATAMTNSLQMALSHLDRQVGGETDD